MSDDIQHVIRMFPIDNVTASTNFFDIKYQMMLNDITDLNNYAGDIAYYEQMQQHLSLLDMKLSGVPIINFDRQGSRLYWYHTKEDFTVGHYLMLEVYQDIDPDSGVNSDYNSCGITSF